MHRGRSAFDVIKIARSRQDPRPSAYPGFCRDLKLLCQIDSTHRRHGCYLFLHFHRQTPILNERLYDRNTHERSFYVSSFICLNYIAGDSSQLESSDLYSAVGVAYCWLHYGRLATVLRRLTNWFTDAGLSLLLSLAGCAAGADNYLPSRRVFCWSYRRSDRAIQLIGSMLDIVAAVEDSRLYRDTRMSHLNMTRISTAATPALHRRDITLASSRRLSWSPRLLAVAVDLRTPGLQCRSCTR